ncbi:MAG: hypothetical protein ACI4P5_04045 [Candidatus Fimadaptatus sp.]
MAGSDYAASLRRQNIVMYILLALSVALIVFLGEYGRLDSRDWTRTAEAAQKLLFVWQGYMIWRIARNRRLLREPLELKAHMVKARDERRAAICGQTGRRFCQVFMVAMSVAAAIATMYDMTVFNTLYATLLAALALWGALYIWYGRRM